MTCTPHIHDTLPEAKSSGPPISAGRCVFIPVHAYLHQTRPKPTTSLITVGVVSFVVLSLYLQVAGVLTAGYGPDVLHTDVYGEDIKTTTASGGLSRSMRASAKEQLAAVIVLAQAVPSASASDSTRAAAGGVGDRSRGPAGRGGGQWSASEFASEGKGASSDDEDTAFGINSLSGPGRGLSAADLIPDLTAALMASQRS